jgi:hydroxymethylbilane synthase
VRVRIATRHSPLARWQTDHIATLLRGVDPAIEVEVVAMASAADLRLDVPISSFGGKGVFAKEVQQAVLEGRADLAVHSAKDLPSVTVDGLALAAVPSRGEVRDALVGATLADLRPGSRVATGSNRRRAQLAQLVPGLEFFELRGNMATRLAKAADFDAIVVAAVALERLGRGDRLTEVVDVDRMVPQVGQGALAVEARADDEAAQALVARIEHAPSRRAVDAERAFLAELGGDCELPAGAYATLDDGGSITLRAFLTSPDFSQVHRSTHEGTDPTAVGTEAARTARKTISPA